MWEQQSSIRIWAGTRLHPDLGAARLGQDLPGPARILMLECLYTSRPDRGHPSPLRICSKFSVRTVTVLHGLAYECKVILVASVVSGHGIHTSTQVAGNWD